MPTYEYECRVCGHRFEHSQNMTDKPLAKCPKCNKGLRRLIGNGAGIIFKGSGFYATDYRKPAPKDKKEKIVSPCEKANPSCKGCPQAS